MPDWSYRTIFRAVLFRLPPKLSRDLCLGVIGTLGRSPVGPFVIDFMGHMRPDRRLARTVQGLSFPTPVGLGSGVDVDGAAVAAFARFGFGFIELGPVTAQLCRPEPNGSALERRVRDESIVAPDVPPNPGSKVLAARLARNRALGVRLLGRLALRPETRAADGADEIRRMAGDLAPHVSAFTIDPSPAAGGWNSAAFGQFLEAVARVLHECAPNCAVWLVIGADLDRAEAERRARMAQDVGFHGVFVDGCVRDAEHPGQKQMGTPAREAALEMVRALRGALGDGFAIASSGGVHEPVDALNLLDAGAELVAIDSGLVYSGPGLAKRVNDAVLHASEPDAIVGPPQTAPSLRAPELTWFWLWLLGIGMFVGGALALAIAATRVVLPYDEHFVGMSRDTLETLNARLVPFMTHDRATLAGTMVTIGLMYSALAWFGVRNGLHWAMIAVEASAFAGFASFFLFLGFGYFDPFHAFVSAVLLQMLLLAVHSRLGPPARLPAPDLHNSLRWRLALWGQLLFVAQALAFVLAGLTIAYVGVTSVFVPEDLMFMDTTAHELSLMNPRLLALIAHDRASFGGMLVSSGLVFLMSSLWGFRRRNRWLWWATLFAGAAGYGPAIIVHFAVGYENVWHLTPAFVGLAVFSAGLALSYPYLCLPDAELEQEWFNRRKTAPRATK